MSKDQQERELRAYLALQGVAGAAGKAGDWRNVVAAALRSDDPLSSVFREALASAIEGNMMGHGFRLELAADGGQKKRRQDQFGAHLARSEWMKIGQWMADQIDAGASRADAICGATKVFPASREKCDAALVYHSRATRWMTRIRASDSHLNTFEDDSLLALFHMNDAAGKPLDRQPHIAPEME